MESWNIQAFPLTLLIVLPGFIAVKVYDLLVPSERRDWSRHLIEVVAYGTINFGLWFWLVDILVPISRVHPWLYRIGMSLILFLSPALLGVLAFELLGSGWLRGMVRHPTPTAWDWYFGGTPKCWVLCHLRDGRLVGGVYGERSFAGASPNLRDLYIQQVWRLTRTGRFLRPVEGSSGMLVSVEDCMYVEFFGPGGGHVEDALEGPG